MSSDILVIGDAHSTVGYDNTRFDWLGKYIIDQKPEVVVSIGDFLDLTSLSSFDKGKGTAEGRLFNKDIDHGKDAVRRTFAPMNLYNENRRKNKKGPYRPQLVLTWGNHEYRANKAENDLPHLRGTLVSRVHDALHPFEIVPFRTPLILEGVVFRHYRPNRMGRATSSENDLARTVLHKEKCSSVVGHAHVLDYSETTDSTGRRMFGLVPGCFGHPDYHEEWCAGTEQAWWQGLVLLKGVQDGYPRNGIEFIPTQDLKNEYG